MHYAYLSARIIELPGRENALQMGRPRMAKVFFLGYLKNASGVLQSCCKVASRLSQNWFMRASRMFQG